LKSFCFKYLLLFIIFLRFLNICHSQDDEDDKTGELKLDELIINFNNSPAFDKKQIESIISTGQSDKFDFNEYILDRQRIEKFYFDNGFFDAVIDTSLSINYKSKKVIAQFIVTQKQEYTINKIYYRGIEPEKIGDIYTKKLFVEDEPLIKVNARYNRDALSAEIVRILNFLNNNGYARANALLPEVVKIISDDEKLSHKVDLILNFITGEQYKFGKVKIEVTDKKYYFSDNYVYKQLEFSEGDLYNKENLTLSENNLSRIAIVENARFQVEKLDTVNRVIYFLIKISLRNKYEVQPELVAYEIFNRFYMGLGLSYLDRNFFGGNRTQNISIKGLVHNKDIYAGELLMELLQPNIFNNRKISGKWRLGLSYLSDDIYYISQIDNRFEAFFELPKHTYFNLMTLEWRLSDQRFTSKELVPVIINDSNVSLKLKIKAFYSILTYTIAHNNTDNFAFPTKGFYQSFLIEESGLLGNLFEKLFNTSSTNYIKFSILNNFFINISNTFPSKSVLAIKFRLGSIFEYGDNKITAEAVEDELSINIIPSDWRFIAGGGTSIRGWNARSLGTFNGKENGGDLLFETTIEHRTRPFINSKGLFKDLGFVTFLDVGNLWEKPKNFKFNQIAMAVGFGLRYYTIVGPVRFDIGFKLYDPENVNKEWIFSYDLKSIFTNRIAFQFGIGNSF